MVVKVKTGYRDLNVGDEIHLKKQIGENMAVTKNKGRKEFLIPIDKYNFIKLVSENDVTMNTVFINPEKSECIGMYGAKNHINNMTDLGLNIYNSHEDAEDFIRELSWE